MNPVQVSEAKSFDFRAQDLNNRSLGHTACCFWAIASNLAYGSFRSGMASTSSSFTVGIRSGWLRLLGFFWHRMLAFFSRLFSCCSGSDRASERHAALTVPLKPPTSPAQSNSETAAASRQSVADHNPLADITNRSSRQPPLRSQGKPFQDVETGAASLSCSCCRSLENAKQFVTLKFPSAVQKAHQQDACS